MALLRWEPAGDVQTIQQEMNRLFNSFFDPSSATRNGEVPRAWIPSMDLLEGPDHFIVRADIPGVSDENLSVELEDNVLTISGEREAQSEEREEGYHRRERAIGRFARSLTLPEGVEPESISARLEKGVLELRIPKPEQRKPRRVAINVGEKAAGGGDGVIEGNASSVQPSATSQQREMSDASA